MLSVTHASTAAESDRLAVRLPVKRVRYAWLRGTAVDDYTALTSWWRGLSSDDAFVAVAPPAAADGDICDAAAAELRARDLPLDTPWAGWSSAAEERAFLNGRLVLPLAITYSGPREVVAARLGEPPVGFALHGGERDGAAFIVVRSWTA